MRNWYLIGFLSLLVLLVAWAKCTEAHPLEDRVREIAREEAISVFDSLGGGTEPPIDPPVPPPSSPEDPPGWVDPRFGVYVDSGFWEGFWTGKVDKLGEDGSCRERNASTKWLSGILGEENPDRYLDRGGIRFQLKFNSEALASIGHGEHTVNLASNALSRGDRQPKYTTRIEIANPGADPGRIVLHNYNPQGQGGAQELGKLNFNFVADEWQEITMQWALEGTMLLLNVNGRTYSARLLDGSEGPGRYWGPGHMEQEGAVVWFTLPEKL